MKEKPMFQRINNQCFVRDNNMHVSICVFTVFQKKKCFIDCLFLLCIT